MGASELVSDKESADACACVLEMMVISIGLALTSSVVVCAVDVHRCAVFFCEQVKCVLACFIANGKIVNKT